MKKTLKIIGITLLSIVGLILIAFAIASWLIFTPEKLTSMVNKQLPNYITCPTSFEKVDLTLFKTFPNIGLEINKMLLINKKEGSPSDTVIAVESCIVAMNLMEFINNNAIIVKNLSLNNGFANLYFDKDGSSNLDIFPPSEEDTSSNMSLDRFNIDKIAVSNLFLLYNDYANNMFATIHHLDMDAVASLEHDIANGDFTFKMNDLLFQMKDSVSLMQADLRNATMKLNGNMNLKTELTKLNIQLSLDSLSYLMSDIEDFYFRIDGRELNLNMKGDGKLSDFNGNLNIESPALYANYAKTDYLSKAPVFLKSPIHLNLDEMIYTFKDAVINVFDLELGAQGNFQLAENGDIPMNFTYQIQKTEVKNLLSLVPSEFEEMIKGINVDGNIGIDGTVSGTYNDSLLPIVTANINYKKGTFSYPEMFPYTLTDLQAQLTAHVDMNNESNSHAILHHINTKIGNNTFDISGNINDFMDNMLCNLRVKTKLHLSEWKEMLPDDMNVKMDGWADADLNAKVSMPQIEAMALHKMNINGTIHLKDLDVAYNDSIFAKSNQLTLQVHLPSKTQNLSFKEVLSTFIDAENLNINMIGTGKFDLGKTKLNLALSNFMDSTQPLAATGNFDIAQIQAVMDQMNIYTKNPNGTFLMCPAKKRPNNTYYSFTYKNELLNFKMGDSLSAKTGYLSLDGSAEYDEKEQDMFLQWHPNINANLKNGELIIANIPYPIQIPTVEFDFTPEKLNFKESSVILGNSQFGLSGNVSNIESYWKNEGMLTGVMDFISETTDVDQLMDLVNGFGSTDSTLTAEVTETTSPEDNPFMVPLGVDFRLNTIVKKAKIGTTEIREVGGHLTIKDGVLVLEEYGFTSKAARMQLTALYRSPRKNHLFVGLDFHLLDIDIDELIKMIPTIDTLVPMLKSFDGNAEFHLAGETYLKSNYELKMSTLRGAAALEGHDLYLEEGNAFNKIAGYFMFDKKGKTKVDSLNVEMTVFRNEIDLYPFLIVMDKFKAIVAGRHNLDMNCDYHISLIDCPLPIRLGIDIKGNANDFDKMKFNLVKCKYANLYRPKKQGKREEQTLRLKKLISDSLKENVKP